MHLCNHRDLNFYKWYDIIYSYVKIGYYIFREINPKLTIYVYIYVRICSLVFLEWVFNQISCTGFKAMIGTPASDMTDIGRPVFLNLKLIKIFICTILKMRGRVFTHDWLLISDYWSSPVYSEHLFFFLIHLLRYKL